MPGGKELWNGNNQKAKNNGRALTHTVRAFQLADAVVAVFLLFFCHAAVPPELCGVA